MLEVFPRLPGEDDDALAQRMAEWGVHQGPNVRWEAVLYATQVMIASFRAEMHFAQLAEIGLHALYTYNESRQGGMD